MSKQTIIRLLTGLTFLIFLCPFFQTCSDKSLNESPFLKRNLVKIEEPVSEIITTKTKQDPISEEKSSIENNNIDDDFVLNGYEIAFKTFEDFELQDLSDFVFYCILCFFIVLIISTIQFYFSFKNKFKIIYLLSLINLVLVIFPILSFYFAEILEDINQIKYGYYLFVINTFAIIILSKKIIKNKSLSHAI